MIQMSGSRGATAARSEDGRTATPSELTNQASLQKAVLDLLRFGLKPNFTGFCRLKLEFRRGSFIKSHSTVHRRGMGELGKRPAPDATQLHTDLQRLALDQLHWGTQKDVWGEATIVMEFDDGKFVGVETILTKEFLVLADGKKAA
jgi:hypothetical protein